MQNRGSKQAKYDSRLHARTMRWNLALRFARLKAQINPRDNTNCTMADCPTTTKDIKPCPCAHKDTWDNMVEHKRDGTRKATYLCEM